MRISSSVRSRSARTGAKVAVAVAVAGATLAGAPAAYALPGDSGDIDIRSVSWHSRGDRDGVEVCKFVLAASNFESLPSVPWTITEQPPTVPPGTTLLDTLPLINGSARSETYLLPEGTYQLVWVVPVGPKQKSFKVECPDRGHGGGKPHKPQRPIGAVPAGGGGVPDMEPISSESDSNAGTAAAALVAGGAGAAGLIMMRRRRARGEA
ncbi:MULTISPECIES: hypothetical protein [Streptomyces]|uniref:hypothetical protein n=1 Tax=Streptomyces TaxID=1883 RepID=UPI0004C61F6A|nr:MULTISPECIES: hypothetical protein [Streptomyces]NDZ62868.1 hypothetical protein [Streptomyces cyaneofuscatus]ONI52665.1 hypothetical protein STIB_32250 [Streptomyces sp. IB2014 011-1]RDV51471.1 hypothetical protein DDV98_13400 [Streptomyces sp. IB2014 011-12]CAD5917479.1 conserved exported protein of unknown function [Streptomyces sp. KY75]CAD5992346.1 conserved exported protein of unknown function [Streptomyces sp. KY70]